MNKKYLPALVSGFGAAVLTTIPGVDSVACCLLVPFASGASIYLYKKSQTGLLKIETKTGIFLGFLTAVFAAIFASSFELIITYLTNSSDLVVSLPQAEQLVRDMNLGQDAEESLKIMRQMVLDIQTKGFSLLYSVLITLLNLITYSIFGIVGGMVATAIINKRNINSV